MEVVDCIDLAEDRNKQLAVMGIVIKFRVP
jgi:hypothetical protein